MTAGNDYLQVLLSDSITPPSAGQDLLVAFRFGQDPNAADHPAIVDVSLDPIGREFVYECWWIRGSVSYRNIDAMRVSECADYTVLIQDLAEPPSGDLAALTKAAYRDIFEALQATAHSRMAKVWNYLGAINEGDGDEERYRKFSVGRAAAFAEFALLDHSAPAGTGIGTTRARGLTIITLASRHPLLLAENPRQTSAFQYPRQYGPSSPKFARGAAVFAGSHALHLLSGTAAIVGHESLHPADVELQLDETLRNIAALGESISVLDGDSVHRVYMREPGDINTIAAKLESQLGIKQEEMLFLRGDICRSELLIEIDGVRIPRSPR